MCVGNHVTPKSRQAKGACAAQVWLQEFAWSEAGKRQQLAARDAQGQSGGQSHDQCKLQAELRAEPMFCIDSAINLLYMSAVVYDCDEVDLDH